MCVCVCVCMVVCMFFCEYVCMCIMHVFWAAYPEGPRILCDRSSSRILRLLFKACVSQKLCIWVTNYVYASRTMYMRHDLCICVTDLVYVWVTSYVYVSRTMCKCVLYMFVYMSHELCICITTYVYESHTMYMWVFYRFCVYKVTNFVYASRLMYMSPTLCICSHTHKWSTWVTNYVYVSSYVHASRLMCMSHELCICVTHYVYASQCLILWEPRRGCMISRIFDSRIFDSRIFDFVFPHSWRQKHTKFRYGVATISRLLKNYRSHLQNIVSLIRLFWKRDLQLRGAY